MGLPPGRNSAAAPWFLASEARRSFAASLCQQLLERLAASRSDLADEPLLAQALVMATAGYAPGHPAPDAATMEAAESRLRPLLAAHRDHAWIWLAYAQLQAAWGKGKMARKVTVPVLAAVSGARRVTHGFTGLAGAVLELVRNELVRLPGSKDSGPRAASLLCSLGLLAARQRASVAGQPPPPLSMDLAVTPEALAEARRGYSAVAGLVVSQGGRCGAEDPSMRSTDAPLTQHAAQWLACFVLHETLAGGRPGEGLVALSQLGLALEAAAARDPAAAAAGSAPPRRGSRRGGFLDYCHWSVCEVLTALALDPKLQPQSLFVAGVPGVTPGIARGAIERFLDGGGAPCGLLLRCLASLEEKAMALPRLKARLGALLSRCSGDWLGEEAAIAGLTPAESRALVEPVVMASLAAAIRTQRRRAEAGVRHLLERVLVHAELRHSPRIWQIYLAWETACGGGPGAPAARSLVRAVSNCPWSKDLLLLGASGALGSGTGAGLAALLSQAGGVGSSPALSSGASGGVEEGFPVRDVVQVLEALQERGLRIRADLMEVLAEMA